MIEKVKKEKSIESDTEVEVTEPRKKAQRKLENAVWQGMDMGEARKHLEKTNRVAWRLLETVVGILTRKCVDEDVQVFEVKGVLDGSIHARYGFSCIRRLF